MQGLNLCRFSLPLTNMVLPIRVQKFEFRKRTRGSPRSSKWADVASTISRLTTLSCHQPVFQLPTQLPPFKILSTIISNWSKSYSRDSNWSFKSSSCCSRKWSSKPRSLLRRRLLRSRQRLSKVSFLSWDRFTQSFVQSFIPSFIYSFIRSFILSFIHSFIHVWFLSVILSVIHTLILSFSHSFIP